MFANIGPWQLLIILVIVLAIFGTKKLRHWAPTSVAPSKAFVRQ